MMSVRWMFGALTPAAGLSAVSGEAEAQVPQTLVHHRATAQPRRIDVSTEMQRIGQGVLSLVATGFWPAQTPVASVATLIQVAQRPPATLATTVASTAEPAANVAARVLDVA